MYEFRVEDQSENLRKYVVFKSTFAAKFTFYKR